MPAPAIVMGDRVTGMCPIHQIPGPPVGNPILGPPMPFSAPLTMNLATTVFIGGKPAAVMGSQGMNTPPHVGLHASDPFMVPTMQMGRVVTGSPTVFFNNKPAATAQSSAMMCATPAATIVPTAVTVLIG